MSGRRGWVVSAARAFGLSTAEVRAMPMADVREWAKQLEDEAREQRMAQSAKTAMGRR